MKRLTEKHWRNLDPWECCGQDNYCKRGCHEKGGCNNGCIVPRVYSRLAAYEDTGLMPEQITDLKQAWDMYGGEIGISEILAENRELKEKRTPKCYSEDADGGCRYLVPDGDDEPIDRCKRCPLCYADKQRHQKPPTTPLTLEELRRMDGEPVYIAPVDGGPYVWMLVDTEYEVLRGAHGELAVFENIDKTWLAYRRKPEEGTT